MENAIVLQMCIRDSIEKIGCRVALDQGVDGGSHVTERHPVYVI